EPTATQAEKQGYVVKWKGWSQITPWRQPSYIAVSKKFLEANRAAVVRLLEVYTLAAREVNASNGTWTPELISVMTKWAEMTPDVITDQGLAPYYDPNSGFPVDGLKRMQDIYVGAQLVQEPVDVTKMVDDGVRTDALKSIGTAR